MVDPDKPSRCKLGITKNPQQRLRAYRTAAPQCFFYKLYDDVDRLHEKRILEIIKDIVHADREYVHCTPLFAQRIIEGYFSDVGISYK